MRADQFKTKGWKRPWFRYYAETLHDPKVLRLQDHAFRAWINLLCVACSSDGVLPGMADLACHLRMEEASVERILADLVEAGLIDVLSSDNGRSVVFAMHNWQGRQFNWDSADPTSKERSKRYRQKKSKKTVTVASRSRHGASRMRHGENATEFCSVSESVSVSSTSLAAREDAYHDEGGSAEVGAGIHPTHGKPTCLMAPGEDHVRLYGAGRFGDDVPEWLVTSDELDEVPQ